MITGNDHREDSLDKFLTYMSEYELLSMNTGVPVLQLEGGADVRHC